MCKPTRPEPGAESVLNRGDRVELTGVPDDYLRFALAAGEQGTVESTDSLGTIHVAWDNGARVGIIAEAADMIRRISDARWISDAKIGAACARCGQPKAGDGSDWCRPCEDAGAAEALAVLRGAAGDEDPPGRWVARESGPDWREP
jgi:hypothetical protein